MRVLSTIDPNKDPRWDTFVEDHPFGQVYHLSSWKTFLENSFKHIKGSFYVLLDGTGSVIQAGLPVYEVKSWLVGSRLVSAPFATLFDPLVTDMSQMEIFLKEIIRLSIDRKYAYAEIRTLQASPYVNNALFAASTFYKHHFINLDIPIEKLWNGFHRTCVRQRITRSEKCNLYLRFAEDESDIKEFYRLLAQTRKRLLLFTQPYQSFKSLWDAFYPTGRLKLMLAKKNGLTIAAILLFFFKNRVSVDISAYDESFKDCSPVHLLFWEAIKLAHEKGYQIFDFGRTSPHNTSLMEFKRRWGAQEVDLTNYFYPTNMACSVDRREDSWKYRVIRQIASLPLPGATRSMMSRILYRHMG